MKHPSMNTRTTVFSLLFVSFLAFCTSCAKDESANDATDPIMVMTLSEEHVATFIPENLPAIMQITEPLSSDEIEFLYALREDEKLAHDLISAFSTQYPEIKLLDSVVTGETSHVAAIETILEYYEIAFSAQGHPGVFTDELRQARYNDLIAHGRGSIENAYRAAALMEEANAVVYQDVIAGTPNKNLQIFLLNLTKSSVNHFGIYVNQLKEMKITYEPTLMDQNVFNDILKGNFSPKAHKYGQYGAGQTTNSAKAKREVGEKGAVNESGDCTACILGINEKNKPARGEAGKNYRGGKYI